MARPALWWESRLCLSQQTQNAFTNEESLPGKNWHFLHDTFHRLWIKYYSKINIKQTQWRKCHLCRPRHLDDFGWIDYASQKYSSFPQALLRYIHLNWQGIGGLQSANRLFPHVRGVNWLCFPWNRSLSEVILLWRGGVGEGVSEKDAGQAAEAGLIEDSAMHHHGVLTLHTGKHLVFLCCISQWEIILLLLAGSIIC